MLQKMFEPHKSLSVGGYPHVKKKVHVQTHTHTQFYATFMLKCIPNLGKPQPPDVRTCRNPEVKSKER